MRIADLPPAKNSEARERLLETAARIFYAEGINTVGVDRIIKEAGVTLATFYRHFPSKQDLILAYLQRVHDDFNGRAEVAREAAKDPGDMLKLIGNNITAQLLEPGFRGCAFINAASEFEDPDGPIMRAVLTHRTWFHDLVRDTFASAGHGLRVSASGPSAAGIQAALSKAHIAPFAKESFSATTTIRPP
jgi:AcrR family transcriptional regulator